MANLTNITVKQSTNLARESGAYVYADTVRKEDIDNLYKMINELGFSSNSVLEGNVNVETCKLLKKDALEKRFGDFKVNITGEDGGIIIDANDSENEAALMTSITSLNWSARSDRLTASEVVNIPNFQPNHDPHTTLGPFENNTEITDFSAFQYFTGFLYIWGGGWSNSACHGVFRRCTKLHTIILPASVTKIYFGSFDHCTNLVSINLDNVTEINTYGGGYANNCGAFYGCSNLENINISNVVSIFGSVANDRPHGAFAECSKLALTELPPHLVHLGMLAFASTQCNFTSLPSNVISVNAIKENNTVYTEADRESCIYYNAYNFFSSSLTHPLYNSHLFCFVGKGAEALTVKAVSNSNILTDGEGVVTLLQNLPITRAAFKNDTSLTKVKGMSRIDRSAFEGCTNLSGVVDYNEDNYENNPNPEAIKVYADAFKGCSKITDVKNIKLGSQATSVFLNCTSITYITQDWWDMFKTTQTQSFRQGWNPLMSTGIVPNNTFYGCIGIVKGLDGIDDVGDFTVPEGIYYYLGGCFGNLSGITGTISIPVWVNLDTTGNMFSTCYAKKLIIRNLTGVSLLNTFTFKVFERDTSRVKEVVFPNDLPLYFGRELISCKKTTKINLNNCIEFGNTSLQRDHNVASNTNALRSIEFNKVEKIQAFDNLDGSSCGIRQIFLNLNNVPIFDIDMSQFKVDYLRFYIPYSMLSDYLNDTNNKWSAITNRLVPMPSGEAVGSTAISDTWNKYKKIWYGVNFWSDEQIYYDTKHTPDVSKSNLFIISYSGLTNSQTGALFGNKASNNNTYCVVLDTNGSKIITYAGAFRNENSSTAKRLDYTKHTLITDMSSYVKYDELSYTYTVGSQTVPNLSLYIGARNLGNNLIENLLNNTSIHSFTWIEDGVVIQNWVANENNGFDIYASELIDLQENDVIVSLLSAASELMIYPISMTGDQVTPGTLLRLGCITDGSLPIFNWTSSSNVFSSVTNSPTFDVVIPTDIAAGSHTITATSIQTNPVTATYSFSIPEASELTISGSSALKVGASTILYAVTDGSKLCSWSVSGNGLLSTNSGSQVTVTSTGVAGDIITVTATYTKANNTTIEATHTITTVSRPAYIQLDGNCYFDTDYVTKANTVIEFTAEVTSYNTSSSTWTRVLGGETTKDGTDGVCVQLNDGFWYVSGSVNKGAAITLDRSINIRIENSTFTMDGVSYNFTARTDSTSKFAIGSMYRNGSIQSPYFNGKFYEINIYEGSTLVRNYIPYDTNQILETLSGTIITKKGSGTASIP